MPGSTTLKRFTVSLDTQDYEALCTLAWGERQPLSPQYMARLAIGRFPDKHEGSAIILTSADVPAKRSKR